jgi:hypothetical protein
VKAALDLDEIADAPGEAINLGDDQNIIFANEINRRFELRPFGVNAR